MGGNRRALPEFQGYSRPDWSSDGEEILFHSVHSGRPIFAFDVDDWEFQERVSGEYYTPEKQSASWGPNDTHFAWGANNLYVARRDGSHPRQIRLLPNNDPLPAWQPEWFQGDPSWDTQPPSLGDEPEIEAAWVSPRPGAINSHLGFVSSPDGETYLANTGGFVAEVSLAAGTNVTEVSVFVDGRLACTAQSFPYRCVLPAEALRLGERALEPRVSFEGGGESWGPRLEVTVLDLVSGDGSDD